MSDWDGKEDKVREYINKELAEFFWKEAPKSKHLFTRSCFRLSDAVPEEREMPHAPTVSKI